MNTKNEIYNLLTSFVEEEQVTVNFLRGFDFRNNFLKMYDFIITLDENTDSDIEITSAFDYESEDEYINTFRRFTISYDKDLYNTIKSLIKDDKRFSLFKAKEINKKKKKSHGIEIIIKENFEN